MDSPSLWESKVKSWMERYEEASANQYSDDVQVLLRVKEARDGKTLAYNTHPAAFKPPVEVHAHMRSLPHSSSHTASLCWASVLSRLCVSESRAEE